jgi:hypothetical protein
MPEHDQKKPGDLSGMAPVEALTKLLEVVVAASKTKTLVTVKKISDRPLAYTIVYSD